jgi:hypothetical protein
MKLGAVFRCGEHLRGVGRDEACLLLLAFSPAGTAAGLVFVTAGAGELN